MSRVVTQFAPLKLMRCIVAQLSTITEAAGYQNEPLVTKDIRVASDATGAQSTLLVTAAAMPPTASGMPHRWEGQLELVIVGSVRPGDKDPTEASFALLQDVLNVLTGETASTAIATAVSNSVMLSFGSVEFDEPWMTLEDGLAGWTLRVNCGFVQTPPW